MNCRHCSKELKPDWQFCPQCGRDLAEKMQPRSGAYGPGVRGQVFEVIVRQGLAGAPWRLICAGPMKVNNITAEEVQAEINRRRGAS